MTHNNSSEQPELILSPADVSKITKSNLHSTKFANAQYAEIAQLLEDLSVLERAAETKLRAWKHDKETYEDLSQQIETDMHNARKRMHDILLAEHSYPHGPQLVLMPSDSYAHDNFHSHTFKDDDMQNLAHNIQMIASFEQELETYLARRGGYEEGERQAMIKDTLYRLHQHKDHLTKILTGYFDEEEKQRRLGHRQKRLNQ
ncbi:MAG TPA: hypothetical protein VHA78_05905 [Candidatus Peribacteraceae bacterium]|nr:hypothetical protein [Candidatus Peribacteraceae bacterium]